MGSARNKIHMYLYYIRFYMVVCVEGRMYINVYIFFLSICVCVGEEYIHMNG